MGTNAIDIEISHHKLYLDIRSNKLQYYADNTPTIPLDCSIHMHFKKKQTDPSKMHLM